MRYLFLFGWKLGFFLLAAAAVSIWLGLDRWITIALVALGLLKLARFALPYIEG